MSLRVIVSGKPKVFWTGGAAKASPNRALELVGVDPKPDDLPMARLKRG